MHKTLFDHCFTQVNFYNILPLNRLFIFTFLCEQQYLYDAIKPQLFKGCHQYKANQMKPQQHQYIMARKRYPLKLASRKQSIRNHNAVVCV